MKATKETTYIETLISKRANGKIIGFVDSPKYTSFLAKLKKELGYSHREFINTTSKSGAIIVKPDGVYLGGAVIADAGTGYKIAENVFDNKQDLEKFIFEFCEKYGLEFNKLEDLKA